MSKSFCHRGGLVVLVLGTAFGCRFGVEEGGDMKAETGRDAATGGSGGVQRIGTGGGESRADGRAAAGETIDGSAAGGRADEVPDARSQYTAPVDGSAARVQRPFDLTVLHQIAIDVTSDDWAKVTSGAKMRVPSTMTFDGIVLPMTGLRRKGFYSSISTSKPALSVKFDEFVPNQKLDGLDKFTLNNARQDGTFLREHIGYELYRAAGLPGPRTAHGVVTVNLPGQAPKVLGLYVIKESPDKDFLAHNFGKAFARGNLYEGTICDFVANPTCMDLQNAVEEMRKRDDIIALANLIKNTPDAMFESVVSTKLRLAEAITGFAIDAISGHWDSYQYGINNYYLYDNPADGRFVFLPHGMDWLFNGPDDYAAPDFAQSRLDPTYDPFAALNVIANGRAIAANRISRLGTRMRMIPALHDKFRAEVGRLIRSVWDVAKLTARIDQTAKVVTSSPVPHADIDRFKSNVAALRDYIAKRRAYVESVTN